MAKESRIISKLTREEYAQLLLEYSDIRVSPHARFRLSQKQREQFTEKALADILVQRKPLLIGIQENGRYAVIFREGFRFLRVVFELKQNATLEIVTFLITDTMPRIENE